MAPTSAKQWPNKITRIGAYEENNAYTFYPVIIVGAGESGIAMGCRMKQKLDFDQFRIFDRQGGVGGTWWINRYPGVACDIPAVFYSYSFAPNHHWSSFYPKGREIVQYLNGVCAKFGIMDKIQLNTSVDGCKWLEEGGVWEVYLTHMASGAGDLSANDRQARVEREGHQAVFLKTETVRAKILISAVGGLVEPKKWPDHIPGTETFQGEMFHSARWRHDVDFNDKHVLVIGTGCSAAQVIPEIIKAPYNAKSVTQVMRSPPWVSPRAAPPIVGNALWENLAPRLFPYLPILDWTFRFLVFAGTEDLFRIFGTSAASTKKRDQMERKLLDHLYKTVPKKYHRMLTPNYSPGCKRFIFDNKWLPSMNDPKVELTTQPLTQVKPHSVTLGMGSLYPDAEKEIEAQEREIPVDVIVLANGFETTKYLQPLKVAGVGGKDFVEEMEARGGPQAYMGTALDGFPNFLLIFGPNTATGHSSVILATENMVTQALKFVKMVLDGDATTFEVKREAEEAYTSDIQKALKETTVWGQGGCQSWYFDPKTGWNSTMYPYTQTYFGWRCHRPTWSDWNIRYTWKGALKNGVLQILRLLALLGLIIGGYAALRSSRTWSISQFAQFARGMATNMRSRVLRR